MKKWIGTLYHNDVVRYIFFGGLTTLVNVGVFYLLRRFTPIPREISNTISVVTAILFAFVTNSAFVFHSQAKGVREHFMELLKFFGARVLTLVIEVGGVYWLAVMGMHEMAAKIATQFIVIALNYVFSKFLVFVKK